MSTFPGLRAARAAKKREMAERLARIRAGMDEPLARAAPRLFVGARLGPEPSTVIRANRLRAQAERPSLYWTEPA